MDMWQLRLDGAEEDVKGDCEEQRGKGAALSYTCCDGKAFVGVAVLYDVALVVLVK